MHAMNYGKYFGTDNVVGWGGDDASQVVKSASRALRILELFDLLKREALVSEVSDLLDLPQSSTSVLLRSLEVIGYLHYNPETRAYAPTTRVALLGNWINGPMLSDGPLVRLLHSINAKTGQAVVLAGRNQIWSQYIHVLQATHAVRIFLAKGAKRPLVRSATGLMLLTEVAHDEIKRLCTRFNAEHSGNGEPVSIPKTIDKVEEARSAGYVVTDGAVTPGAGMIAMNLPQLESSEQFVVGIAAVSEVMARRSDEFIEVMREELAKFSATAAFDHVDDRLAS